MKTLEYEMAKECKGYEFVYIRTWVGGSYEDE